MPRGGSKPGERRGGRKKGVPNKAAIAKAAAIKEEARREGKPLSLEIQIDAMFRYRSLAAQFQPGAKDKDGNSTADPKKYADYIEKMRKAAVDVTPYQTPKLQSTTLVGDRDKPITHQLTVKFV